MRDTQSKTRRPPLQSALAQAGASRWLKVLQLPYLHGRAAPPGVHSHAVACRALPGRAGVVTRVQRVRVPPLRCGAGASCGSWLLPPPPPVPGAR